MPVSITTSSAASNAADSVSKSVSKPVSRSASADGSKESSFSSALEQQTDEIAVQGKEQNPAEEAANAEDSTIGDGETDSEAGLTDSETETGDVVEQLTPELSQEEQTTLATLLPTLQQQANWKPAQPTGTAQAMGNTGTILDSGMEAVLSTAQPDSASAQTLLATGRFEPLTAQSQAISEFSGEQLDAAALQELIDDSEQVQQLSAAGTTPAALHRPMTAQFTSVVTQNSTQPGVNDTPLEMINDPDWSDDLGKRLISMVTDENGIKEAKIRLDPPSLGTLELQLRVEDNKVSVQFHSPSPVVREMITQHLDKLRAQINDGEMSLVNVDVSSGEQQQQKEVPQELGGGQRQGIGGRYGDGDDFSLSQSQPATKQNHDFSGRGRLSTYA